MHSNGMFLRNNPRVLHLTNHLIVQPGSVWNFGNVVYRILSGQRTVGETEERNRRLMLTAL